jgi:uncharacterized Fe-S center protein
MPSPVYFAGINADKLEPGSTLPAKFLRLLDRCPLAEMVRGRTVAVKMHLGGELGYTTIHPLFTRLLVQRIKEAGGKPFVTDLCSAIPTAKDRGYTEETVARPWPRPPGSSTVTTISMTRPSAICARSRWPATSKTPRS